MYDNGRQAKPIVDRNIPINETLLNEIKISCQNKKK